MLHFVLIAALSQPCGGNLNQADLDVCWVHQADIAQGKLDSAFAKLKTEATEVGLRWPPFTAAQAAWNDAREKTCAFEASLEEGGSIAPMMYSECQARMAQARTEQVHNFYLILAETGRANKPDTIWPKAAKEYDRVYGLLLKQDLGTSPRTKLLAAQSAWNEYRDKECALEGGSCLTELAMQRTRELKDGWLGEPFW